MCYSTVDVDVYTIDYNSTILLTLILCNKMESKCKGSFVGVQKIIASSEALCCNNFRNIIRVLS